MNRQKYNALLAKTGIYEKRELKKGDAFDSESEFVFQESEPEKVYEIIPNDLSNEEIKIALLAKQNLMMKSIGSNVSILTIVIVIPAILGFILFLLSFRR